MSLPTPLINRDRAQLVMAEFGVSAMVLADPTNIYHATGFWPQTLVMGQQDRRWPLCPPIARSR